MRPILPDFRAEVLAKNWNRVLETLTKVAKLLAQMKWIFVILGAAKSPASSLDSSLCSE
ncbi:MAG TPA: hypothetical protein VM821_07225 [Abditibacteriaceae bacterium]|nr:hypothetical protein [Abditibacteriaceae bacterium]